MQHARTSTAGLHMGCKARCQAMQQPTLAGGLPCTKQADGRRTCADEGEVRAKLVGVLPVLAGEEFPEVRHTQLSTVSTIRKCLVDRLVRDVVSPRGPELRVLRLIPR